MNRKVLLLEADYKNRYPPIGLMKLATYHKMLGDSVRFFKGRVRDFIAADVVETAIEKFRQIDPATEWQHCYRQLEDAVKNGIFAGVQEAVRASAHAAKLFLWAEYYREFYISGEYKKHPKWDRVCVTSLFTFQWERTVAVIKDAKVLVKDRSELRVGGILATVMHNELAAETGIRSHKGLLKCPGALDDNDIIIDTLPLDYSILFDTDYVYSAGNAFYAYTTRGCPNRCSFCVVPVLEPPPFNSYIPIVEQINDARQRYGDKLNLLLMDNNVLASEHFSRIIDDIKACGFGKGSRFTEPDYLKLYIAHLESGEDDRLYSRAVHACYQRVLGKLRREDRGAVYNILRDARLLDVCTCTKSALLGAYPAVNEFIKRHRFPSRTLRSVDFNQGLDASLLSEERVKLLSEVEINPLRIAFDTLQEKDIYSRAVRLCAKYGMPSLSNYMLYNEKDTPDDLYLRLEINILLCDELDIAIYSFPMKYHPIAGDFSKNRDYMGKHWNRKYIRAVQSILNATKGKIGRGRSFFYEAFGKTLEDYHLLLLLPELYLLYRFFFRHLGYTAQWYDAYARLSEAERAEFFALAKDNHFRVATFNSLKNERIKDLYRHYVWLDRNEMPDTSTELGRQKAEFDASVKKRRKWQNI